LTGGLSILLVTDAVYGGMQIAGTYSGPGNFLDAAWLGFYLLFWAAALHPSMAALTDPAPVPESPATLSRWRIAVLATASLVAPATLLIEYRIRGTSELTEDLVTAAVFSAILFLLVIARLAEAVKAQRKVAAERERATESFRRAAKQQTAVAQLGLQAAEGIELEALMDRAVQAVARCLDADYTRIFEGEPDGERLTLTASVGQEHLVGEARVDGGADTHAGYTLRVGRPVVMRDLRMETRFEGVFLLERHGIRSGVSAPINGGDRPYGVIAAHSTQPDAFDDQDATFLQAVANVLTVAISRDQAEQLHTELERRRRLESTSQLAGGIAHDFNNLLGVILNYAAFTEDDLDRDPGAARGDLAEVRKAADQAADLTRQMLIFGRGPGRRLHALEINPIVRDAEGLLRSTVGERIALRLELEPDLRRTQGDPAHIQQILVNLVLNARDAMPRGGTLVIETRNVEVSAAGQMNYPVPPGNYIRLAVSDTGIGMSEEVVDRAFDPFFTTKPAGKGTGLGLANVYRLVRDSGGEVRLDSKPERGTTVRIYLPASSEGAPVAAPDARGSANGRRASAGSETILIAEDDDDVRGLTARILTGNGYSVIQAEDADQAQRACERRNGEIDLLLTDVVMPGMSGNELGERILERYPRIKVLYMSGYADDVMAGEGVVLQKPFPPERLLSEVREILAR
jgi:signal transduction histidine kinase